MGKFIQKISVFVLFSILFLSNLSAQTNVSGNITNSITWSKAGSPYNLTSNVTVNSGVTLTIEPGVIIQAQGHISLSILGTIIARGTQQDSIIFKGNGNKGSWVGLKIRNSGSTLNSDYTYSSGSIFSYVSISDADNAIYQFNCSLYVEKSNFSNNTLGIEHRSTSITIVKESKFYNNTKAGYVNSIPQNALNDGDNISDGLASITNLKYDNCKFINNTIGMFAEYQCSCSGVFDGFTLTNTEFLKNSTAIQFGVNYVYYMQNALISNNKFLEDSTAFKFFKFGGGANNLVKENLFYNNLVGLWMSQGYSKISTSKNIFLDNDIAIINDTKAEVLNSNFVDNSSNINIYCCSSEFEFKNNLLSDSKKKSKKPLLNFSYLNSSNIASVVQNNFTFINPPIIQTPNLGSGVVQFDANFIDNNLNYSDSVLYKVPDYFNSNVVVTNSKNNFNLTNPISLVKNVTKDSTGSGIVLTWTANSESDIAGYKIYYGGYTGYSYTNSIDVGNITSTTLPYSININDDIAITAYDASKTGIYDQLNGNESWYSPANSIPKPPNSLDLDFANKRISLNWSSSNFQKGVDSFFIYKSTDGSVFSHVGSTSKSLYIDSLLTPNTRYYYKVTSFRNLDLSYDRSGLESPFSITRNAVPNRTMYVSNTGSDSNIGSSQSPLLTISAAIGKSSNGDTILLNKGTYSESIDFNNKSLFIGSLYDSAFNDTTFISQTILDGSNLGSIPLFSNVGVNNSKVYGISMKNVPQSLTGFVSNFKIQKCSISNSGNAGTALIGLSSNQYLIDCDLYNNKAGAIITTNRNTNISSYIINTKIHHNNLSLSGGTKCILFEGPLTMINCQVYKNYYQSAIEMGDNAQSATFKLYFSTITENFGAGLNFAPWSGGYTAYVANNIISNNAADLNFEDRITGPTIKMYNNLIPKGIVGLNINSFYNLTYTGNYNLSPIFNDTTNFDFTLKANSPGIGYGNFDIAKHIDTVNNDYLYNIRPLPLGSKPDLGAFENNYKHPSPTIVLYEPNDKKVKLTFSVDLVTNSLDSILSYKIYRSNSIIADNSNITEFASINSASLYTYFDSVGLNNNVRYYYRIKTVYKDNTLSGFSNQVAAIPNMVEVPKSVTIVNNPNNAKLSWNLSATLNNKFQIFRSIDTINKSLLVDTLTKNYFNDSTLLRNTKYYYWLRAIDSTGAYSNYSSAITLNPTNSWYVDSAIGNDTTGYGTLLSPYKKLQKAIDISIGSDTILVKSGTYIENLLINKKTTIISQDGALKTSIKPLLPNSQIVNFTSGALDSKIKGFKLFNGGNVRGSAIDCNFSNPIIENCIITNSAGEAPIRFYYSAARITNCLIYKNTANNVFFYDPNDYIPTITHSTIAYNVGIGTGVSNSINIPIFTNTIIYGNTGGSYSGNINILNSIVQGGYPGNSTNIDANPKFTDSLNNNFHLSNYSPAIGIGKKAITETKDFDLNNRIVPIGSFPDAGAYENINDHPAPYLTDSTTSTQIKISSYQYPTTGLSKVYIYKGFVSAPASKSDSISVVNSYTDTANNTFDTYIYYRFTSIGAGFNESGFSNEIKTIVFSKPTLNLPVNNSFNNDTLIKFSWSKNDNAILYKLQYSLDSNFVNNVVQKLVSDTSITLGNFNNNTTYYWRVLATDTLHNSPWSLVNKFQTFIKKPILDSVNSLYKNLNLFWTNYDSLKTKYIKIFKDSLGTPNLIIDSISGKNSSYKDTKNLVLNQKYYYRIKYGNYDNIESDYSNILSAIPINTPPKVVKLIDKIYNNIGEVNFARISFSSIGSVDIDGKITNYNWYVNDSLVNKIDSNFSYNFKLGTNTVKLVIVDNDGGKDSSSAKVILSTLVKQFNGGVLGGISAINQNFILTADSTYDNIIGSSAMLLDRSGNTILPIVVQSKIFTTPSISVDSSIFITNGSNLNGYSKAGVSLWPTIPLGGISYVTPTVDTLLNRIYVGVSNKNFFAYDYKTGKNIWNVICDAPINTSAVITGDRKLIFTSQSGTLYGFDVSKVDVQTNPKWKMSFGDIVQKSPAIDANSNIYVGTSTGRLIKFSLNTDSTVTVKWNVTLNSPIQTSPVIDADSSVYVGTEKGDLIKINNTNGSVIWTYNVGAPIHSTPNISEFGTVYVSNMNGVINAVNTDKRLLWSYNAKSPISANSLYINNMLYVATESGSYIGIYDNPNSVTVNTSPSSIFAADSMKIKAFATISNGTIISPRNPIWGTFQGDYRRTGSLSISCPATINITRDSSGTLNANIPNYIQWYKNGNALPGIVNQAFKPTDVGSYSVKNNQVGCSIISSNSYYYIVTDVIEINSAEFIKLVPNPFSNNVNFSFVLKEYQKLNLEIYELSSGRKVEVRQNIYSGTSIQLGQLSSGIYIFKVTTPDNKTTYSFKMVKL